MREKPVCKRCEIPHWPFTKCADAAAAVAAVRPVIPELSRRSLEKYVEVGPNKFALRERKPE